MLLVGAGCGVIGVGGATVLAALLLNLSGGSLFDHLVGMLVLSHAPVFVVDALISALALNLLWRMLPDMTRELCP
ncbi:energy-coupling factor ABC transporter permease [Halopseudomonas pachastrellae]|nr:energy-coupling factor ABC transporter permease [Halopseudomonas pachastrellae]